MRRPRPRAPPNLDPDPNNLRTTMVEISDRKVVVDSEVFAGEAVTARGHTVAVRMPDDRIPA